MITHLNIWQLLSKTNATRRNRKEKSAGEELCRACGVTADSLSTFVGKFARGLMLYRGVDRTLLTEKSLKVTCLQLCKPDTERKNDGGGLLGTQRVGFRS